MSKYENPAINQIAYGNLREYLKRNPNRAENSILAKLSFVNQLELVRDFINSGGTTLQDPTRRKPIEPQDRSALLAEYEHMGYADLKNRLHERTMAVAPPDATPQECIEIMRRNGVPEETVMTFQRILDNQ